MTCLIKLKHDLTLKLAFLCTISKECTLIITIYNNGNVGLLLTTGSFQVHFLLNTLHNSESWMIPSFAHERAVICEGGLAVLFCPRNNLHLYAVLL